MKNYNSMEILPVQLAQKAAAGPRAGRHRARRAHDESDQGGGPEPLTVRRGNAQHREEREGGGGFEVYDPGAVDDKAAQLAWRRGIGQVPAWTAEEQASVRHAQGREQTGIMKKDKLMAKSGGKIPWNDGMTA